MGFIPRKSGSQVCCSPFHVIICNIFSLTISLQLPELSIFSGLSYIKSISTDYVITLLFCRNCNRHLLSVQEAFALCHHNGPWLCCSSSSQGNVPTRTLCSPHELAPSTWRYGTRPDHFSRCQTSCRLLPHCLTRIST